jgi:hypothetical protein
VGSAFVLKPGGEFAIEHLPPGPVDPKWLRSVFEPDPWETGIRFVGFPISSLVLICSDLGAVKASRGAPGYGLTFVRPWDGSPIFGPSVLLAEQSGPEGRDLFGLENGDAVRVSTALGLFGWRLTL